LPKARTSARPLRLPPAVLMAPRVSGLNLTTRVFCINEVMANVNAATSTAISPVGKIRTPCEKILAQFKRTI